MFLVKHSRLWMPSLFFVVLIMFSQGALADHEEACDWGLKRVIAFGIRLSRSLAACCR